MNSQDITRALIDTTVARAMVEMDADPKRSVRKLCDLGRQFSRGRFQNQIFAIFQDLLRNDESPYYQAIDFLLRSNDPEALRQFGINIGYNSFTYGAQILRQKQKELSFAVPWVVKLRLDSRIPDTYDSSFFASVVRTGLTYGIYSYQLRSMDHHEDMLTVCNPTDDTFQVAIIPYTYEHTNFHTFEVGSIVNLEFDIIGKYISRMIQYK